MTYDYANTEIIVLIFHLLTGPDHGTKKNDFNFGYHRFRLKFGMRFGKRNEEKKKQKPKQTRSVQFFSLLKRDLLFDNFEQWEKNGRVMKLITFQIYKCN